MIFYFAIYTIIGAAYLELGSDNMDKAITWMLEYLEPWLLYTAVAVLITFWPLVLFIDILHPDISEP